MPHVRESIAVGADADAVYDLIADVATVGRYSPEAVSALLASRDLGVGDRFWGVNRRGPFVWVTRCRVLSADRGRTFAFDVDFGPFGVSRWVYEIDPQPGGCTVTESWTDRRTGRRGRLLTAFGALVIPGPRAQHNRDNIRFSLAALKEFAEREASRSVPR